MNTKSLPFIIVVIVMLMPLLSLAKSTQRYKIGLIDLMLLKRQKLGAIILTKQIIADGVEVDMGGLGNRPTFDNQCLQIQPVSNSWIKRKN